MSLHLIILLLVLCSIDGTKTAVPAGHFEGLPESDVETKSTKCPPPAPRRYDITDMGYENLFRGWVDVQGLGAANDFCRFVGNGNNIQLACALAGTIGDSEINYVSQTSGFDRGYPDTWYMKDEDGDGRDDYCRCIGSANTPDAQQVMCTKAGPRGFYGSAKQGGNVFTFSPTGNINCAHRKVRPEFGRVYPW